MSLTPDEVRVAFQDAVPNRRDEFARQVKERHRSIAYENQYVQRFPMEVLAMAEAELRERLRLAASRVKQLINSGWTTTEMVTVQSVYLGMFSKYDRMDKDPHSDLFHAVENAFELVGTHNPSQATLNARRLSEVQVNAATEFLSDLEVYYGEKHPESRAASANQIASDKAAVVESASGQWTHDVFICHASEDKEFAQELAWRLSTHGIKVWLDEFTFTLGDTLQGKIDEGLRNSKYGVVIVSRTFFTKVWAPLELNALIVKQAAEGQKVVLPVWHEITVSEVYAVSPTLAGVFATQSADGIDKVVRDIVTVVRPELVESLPALITKPTGPTTFRAQIFALVTGVRNILKKYGPNPSVDATGDLIMEYSNEYASQFIAIKRHLEKLLGYKRTEMLSKEPVPMTAGRVLRLTELLEQLVMEVPVDLPSYPLEFTETI
jgi:hypothetical protein